MLPVMPLILKPALHMRHQQTHFAATTAAVQLVVALPCSSSIAVNSHAGQDMQSGRPTHELDFSSKSGDHLLV